MFVIASQLRIELVVIRGVACGSSDFSPELYSYLKRVVDDAVRERRDVRVSDLIINNMMSLVTNSH